MIGQRERREKTDPAGLIPLRKRRSDLAESLRAVFSLIACVIPECQVLIPVVQNPDEIFCRQ